MSSTTPTEASTDPATNAAARAVGRAALAFEGLDAKAVDAVANVVFTIHFSGPALRFAADGSLSAFQDNKLAQLLVSRSVAQHFAYYKAALCHVIVEAADAANFWRLAAAASYLADGGPAPEADVHAALVVLALADETARRTLPAGGPAADVPGAFEVRVRPAALSFGV